MDRDGHLSARRGNARFLTVASGSNLGEAIYLNDRLGSVIPSLIRSKFS